MPKIDAAVMKVLEKAKITDDSVDLVPCGQLPRLLYMKVNKVLELAGGKWNRSAKVHLFPSDPRQALGMAMAKGEIADKKKDLQQFFTPPDLAEITVSYGCIQDCDVVMDPSCGDGALAVAMADYNPAKVMLIDVDNAALAKAVRRVQDLLPSTSVWSDCGDFLAIQPTSGMMVDCIVMNPPFTKGQDIKHVTHALRFLKPSGRLVAIMSPSWQTACHGPAQTFREMLQDLDHEVTENPDGSFKQSGTMVSTITLIVRYPEAAPKSDPNPKRRLSLKERARRSRA